MGADIISLGERRKSQNSGNGAREVALAYWKNYAAENGICDCGGWSGMMTDNLLAFLWNEGFKVIPLDAGDPEYDGPDWTGEETPAG